MSLFNAYQLLTETAREYHHQRETFSTAQISARINEIKYLSAQKKVPKLSLRKEIVHLERQLSTVLDVEQQMLSQKKHESAKVKSMKKQITELHSRLAAAEDKDVQKKLDRLSQLLGDYLAKKTTEEEVKTAIAELKLVKTEKEKTVTATKTAAPVEINKDLQSRIDVLQQKLKMLKGELELLKILKKDSRAVGVAEKIALLEGKLNEYRTPTKVPIEPAAAKPEVVVEKPEIKHTILFASPPEKKQEPAITAEVIENEPEWVTTTVERKKEASSLKITDEDLELEAELPLPPPPKMKKN